jgi:cytochrome d ubiquinol oxidase subunit I
LVSGIPVAVAGLTGSLTVISVNAWMNHPQGFAMRGGEVVDVDPWGALFGNPHLWPELTHMYLAGYIVAGLLVAAAYARRWLRGERTRYVRTALVIPLTIAMLATPVQVVVGDWIARRVTEDQPLKLAAFEGLGETTKGAPLHVGGWYHDGEVRWGIEIPKLLSLLAHHDPDATVQGLDSVPPADRPPVNVVRVAFQLMVAIGLGLVALALWHLIGWGRRRRLPSTPWFFRAVIAAAPLSVAALIAGWVSTEVGRQPWVVYEVMRTEDAVTGAAGIPVGYATLVVVYAGLVAAVAWILRRLARVPLELGDEPAPEVLDRAG